MGDTFFFVEEGEASVTKLQSEGSELKEVHVGILKKGGYFGGTLLHLRLDYMSVSLFFPRALPFTPCPAGSDSKRRIPQRPVSAKIESGST
jgi:CRP-like cAMP-binding protein